MTDDRLAGDIKTALAQRRPPPSRELSERLESAAQRPARRWPSVPAALAIAVAAGVLLVVTTRPGQPAEPSGSPVIVPPIAALGGGGTGTQPPDQRPAVEGTALQATTARPRVTVRSSIAGTAYIDGRRVGDTPLTTTVTPGKHELRLDAPGCDPVTMRFEVGDSADMVLELEPRRRRAKPSPVPAPSPSEANGRLTVMTNPSAAVYIDGEPVGLSPIQLTLTPGRHEIGVVRRDQHTRKTLTLDVKPGQHSKLSVNLDD